MASIVRSGQEDCHLFEILSQWCKEENDTAGHLISSSGLYMYMCALNMCADSTDACHTYTIK